MYMYVYIYTDTYTYTYTYMHACMHTCRLHMLVILRKECERLRLSRVCGLKLLVYAALSY
jgi:hypothetical protein